jgi:dihydrofolate reductase
MDWSTRRAPHELHDGIGRHVGIVSKSVSAALRSALFTFALTMQVTSARTVNGKCEKMIAQAVGLCRPGSSSGQDRNGEKAVRDLILKMSISIDGFVSDLEGRNTWMFGADQEAKAWSVEYIRNASLHIMGSRSFHDMAAWWPTSTDQFAPPMNQIPKAVFSRQGQAILRKVNTSAELQPGAGSWAEAYVASGDLAEEIAKLKAQEGRPIIAPLFSELAAPTRLKLMTSKAFPGGAVAQIYRPA